MAMFLFYFSLISLVAMLAIKYFGISFYHHEFISNMVSENDKQCHKIVTKSKHVASKIKFKNFHKVTLAVANFIKREIIFLKRRFDSQQPAFLLSPQRPKAAHKHSVSFFLKKVSEYKDSFNDKNIQK